VQTDHKQFLFHFLRSLAIENEYLAQRCIAMEHGTLNEFAEYSPTYQKTVI